MVLSSYSVLLIIHLVSIFLGLFTIEPCFIHFFSLFSLTHLASSPLSYTHSKPRITIIITVIIYDSNYYHHNHNHLYWPQGRLGLKYGEYLTIPVIWGVQPVGSQCRSQAQVSRGGWWQEGHPAVKNPATLL